ncbi:hypothetical protein QP813_08565 [Aerococcus urinae]|nr:MULTISPECIES: hypothetical protein [Aerococcus]MDK8133219.1 hypothetical protein [Aerococcus urinae]MDK8485372.1 hypothetical protein [Aerococcus urinae]MDL5178309.1 hypothetical protein [Aerococcus tenax]MDL5207324.1 hypothetical protein [Aerococcus tenax]
MIIDNFDSPKKVKYIGRSQGVSLTKNKIYEALGYEAGFIRVIDDTGEDYLYNPKKFQIIEKAREDVNKLTDEEVGAIIQARYNAESLQPETEEDRKVVEERLKKVEEYMKKYLSK